MEFQQLVERKAFAAGGDWPWHQLKDWSILLKVDFLQTLPDHSYLPGFKQQRPQGKSCPDSCTRPLATGFQGIWKKDEGILQ